jgi:hypothetical protein
MQFHAETTAAASSALQHHLLRDLKQHRLWVPPLSSSSNRSSGGTETSHREVPPDHSRLLVLLMGLYHLQMLEQQQDQRRRQHFRQAQQQKEQEWAQQQADRRPKQRQQQQEQNGAHVMTEDGVPRLRPMQAQMNASPAGAAAAAAHCTSPYDDVQIKRKAATSAAAAAYSMPDLLLYCLATKVEQYTQAGNSSSSSSNRFKVCTVSAALVADGTRVSSQVLHGGNSMPADATCDVCSARMSLQIEQQQGFLHMMGQRASPPAAVACDECGGHFWMCTKCAASADVAERHDPFCSAAGTAYSGILQTASKAAGAVLSPSVTSQLNSSSSASASSSSTPVPQPCSCNVCSRALLLRADRADLRWRCSPLVQFSGPWAPEQRYGLQPQWQQQQRQQQLGLLKPRVQKEPQHVTELKRACGLQSCGVPYGPLAHTAPPEYTYGMLSICGAYQQQRFVWEAKAEGV